MATIELSDRFCREARPPLPSQAYVVFWDTRIKGFGLRRTRDSASFIFDYRQHGQKRRYTIGTFQDPWSTSAARGRSAELKKLVDRGEDPQAQRVERRVAPRVSNLIERWRAEHSPRNRPRTQTENESLIRQWIDPELGRLLVSEVEHETINKLHLKIGATGTLYRANRALALASKLFSLAVIWKMRADNPVKGVERYTETPRERPLVEDEFERLLAALQADDDRQAVDMIGLLLLTGARVDELATACWGQLRLTADPPGGIWDKPATNTKQKKLHRTPLSPEAALGFLDLKARFNLAVLPQAYVFPQGDGYRHNLWPAWKRICRRAGLGDLRLHDLRHHFATVLAGEGVSLQIIGRLLGHVTIATTQRYAHLLDSPLQQATNKVGAAFSAAAGRRNR